MNPARMFLESLDRRPGIREQPGPLADMIIARINVRFEGVVSTGRRNTGANLQ